jgi:hypothetical protein
MQYVNGERVTSYSSVPLFPAPDFGARRPNVNARLSVCRAGKSSGNSSETATLSRLAEREDKSSAV